MQRLSLLFVMTALILALSGLGVGDRLAVRRVAADATAAAVAIGRGAMTRASAWRADRAAADAAAQAGAVQPAAGSGQILSGVYRPQDDAAAARLGEATFDGATVRFSRGLNLHTGPERIALASDVWSASGRRFTTLVEAPDPAQIEIRRVTDADLPTGQDVGCGPRLAPAWLALRQRPRAVQLMLFSGAAPPGPGMAETALCGAWTYAQD